MHLFAVVLLLCSNLFSWELACPHGCGGPKDVNRISLLNTIDLCIYRLAPTNDGCSVDIDEWVLLPEKFRNTFNFEAHKRFTMLTLRWSGNEDWREMQEEHFSRGEPYTPPEEKDYIVTRFLDRFVFDPEEVVTTYAPPTEETYFIIGRLHETMAIFEALRRDMDWIFTTQAEKHRSQIQYRQGEIERLKELHSIYSTLEGFGWELYDLNRAITRHTDFISYLKSSINIDFAEKEERIAIIDSTVRKLSSVYNWMYDWCIQHHGWRGAFYERGLLSFYHGRVFNALQDISTFIEASKKASPEELLPVDVFLTKGNLELEIGKYNDAIESLSLVIEKDPKNHKAYLERAAAYFEKGSFDLALQDYLVQKNSSGNFFVDSWDWAAGLTIGADIGITHALKEYLPSMLTFARGMGNMIWTKLSSPEFQKAFVEHASIFSQACEEYFSHPIDESIEAYDMLSQAFGPRLKAIGAECVDAFAHPIQASQETFQMLQTASTEFFTILQSCSKESLARYLPVEFYALVTQWDNLNSFERAQIMGYGLGKYSTDVLLPIATLKGVKAVKVLREFQVANKACTLETLAASTTKEKSLAKVVTELSEDQRKAIALLRIQRKDYLQPLQGKYLDEITIRKILAEGGLTPPNRPSSIPNRWRVKITDKSGGIKYVHPTTTQESVRIMPANPNSPMPCQRRPYAMQMHHGKAVDVKGNLVPKESPEAHIPVEEFIYKEIE